MPRLRRRTLLQARLARGLSELSQNTFLLVRASNHLVFARDLAQDRLRTLVLNHSLLRRDNVVITPHIAFNSREAVRRILDTTVENIQAFLGGEPRNVVNP